MPPLPDQIQQRPGHPPSGGTYDHDYDSNGNRASLSYPNGTSTSYVYDNLNRLRNLTTTGPSGVIQSYDFTLGAAGNRRQIDEADGTTRAYDYDNVYRLSLETVTDALSALVYEKSFVYDDVGNRETQTTAGLGAGTIGYTYDPRDRLLTENATTYGYDANGNLTSKSGDATYTWDIEDRLIRVDKTDGTVVEHIYDTDGVRVRTETTPPGGSTSVTDLLVDTSGSLSHVVAESDGSGSFAALYVRGGDDLLSVFRPTEQRYYHADGLGSIGVLTDESGTVTDTYTYTAFGEELGHVGTDPQPYQFAGEPFDPNVGFYYNRARWLDPTIGRFVSMDAWIGTAFDPASLHRYLYANASPVSNTDPTGLFSLAEASLSLSISGVINAMAGAVFNLFQGETIAAKDLWQDFAVGAITAPVGGLFVRAFAPLIKATLRPVLIALGSMPRVTLVGRPVMERFLVRVSRIFVNTNRHHPPVSSTFLGRLLKRAFPRVRWEQHHVFIQQAWSRAGSPRQLYDDVLANEGLRRVGNGLLNLLPIPASLNGLLGRNPFATQILATAYYSVLVFGTGQTVAAFTN